jgi:Flp pilus assembly protein TadB
MLEVAAAICAGLGVLTGVLAVTAPAPASEPPGWIVRPFLLWWSGREAMVSDAGITWLDATRLAAAECAAAIACAAMAAFATGLPVLALSGAVGGASLVRAAVGAQAHHRQAVRQDAVLDAVRLLRQLLEVGATSINQAIAVLAERGPLPLRGEFRLIAAKSVGRRQAWREARDRVAEPLFDMLAAAVLIQRPGGGELVPLFTDLESSVTAAQEVEREARALQAQARSASSIIVALPLVFLLILAALRSPYLDAFRHPEGELFLLAMLAIMAAGYAWMRRLLELPGLQRVRLTDA